MIFIFALIFTYLLGSLPTGYLMGKWIKNVDIRNHGSGNVGATNVFRVVGITPGIITLIVDFLKGYLPVLYFIQSGNFSLWQLYVIGITAVAGHNWTIFLNFKGGKGVITSAGIFTALLPQPMGISILIFAIIFLIFGRVSLGSIVASFAFPFSVWILTRSILSTIIATLCATVVIVLHRSNIKRLLAGTEPKLALWKGRKS